MEEDQSANRLVCGGEKISGTLKEDLINSGKIYQCAKVEPKRRVDTPSTDALAKDSTLSEVLPWLVQQQKLFIIVSLPSKHHTPLTMSHP